MPAQFKEILKQTKPYYQQGAPLLLEAHAVYEDTATGKLIAQLKWRNLSHQTVQAVNVTLHCKDSFGATLEASTYQYMDVSATPQGFFGTQNAIPLVSERTRQCVVSITGVSYADGSVWSATEEDTCEALPDGKVQTLTGDLLFQFERDVVGKGFGPAAKFIPQKYKDLWQCGCGRWQKQSDDTCASCKATMAQLIELSEPTALAERLAAYQQQQEEKRIAKEKADAEKWAKAEADSIEQEKRNEALKKEQAIAQVKAKKRNILIASVLTVAVAAVLVFTQVIQPKQKYDNAVALMESGQYEEALAAFTKLGDYSDAAVQVQEAQYQMGQAYLNAGEYDQAIEAFNGVSDYSDAAVQVQEAQYQMGQAYLSAGEYDQAIEAFNGVSDYSDAAAQVQEAQYQMGQAYLSEGEYDQALATFDHIRGYKNVNSLITNDENLAAVAQEAKFAVGSTITFGNYEQDNNTSNGKEPIEWLILAKEGKRALVISVYGLDTIQYNKEYENVTWETCTLRTWMNNTFLNAAFTEAEQAAIPAVEIATPNNNKYRTDGGNPIQDKVFCLSIEEAESLFASDDARQFKPTAYAVGQGASTNDDGYWWLRSPGIDQKQAAEVYSDGSVDSRGCFVYYDNRAVRPALWLDLESGIF